jgi:D-alanyl-D-alanine carboxypeptidase
VPTRRTAIPLFLALALACATPSPAAAGRERHADRALDHALHRLVKRPDGPPGAIAVIQRGRHRQVHRAGVADLKTGAKIGAGKRMRVASVSKAFSGAVALSLIDEGALSLNDTIGERLPYLRRDWHRVTLRELLAHTSGLPDFLKNKRYEPTVSESPAHGPPPRRLLEKFADRPLRFTPGSTYEYSNSDNIVVGLMVEQATGISYERALRLRVTDPLGLSATRMASGTLLPIPFIHGYVRANGLEDVSEQVAFGSWTWASGGVVSTPAELNRFVRGYVGGSLFGGKVRRQQYRFVGGGHSHPPGPGANSAGLGLFRYRTRCGTVFGHTGSILGYTQLIAATRSGRRSLEVSINVGAPPSLVPALRKVDTRAVCAALAGR